MKKKIFIISFASLVVILLLAFIIKDFINGGVVRDSFGTSVEFNEEFVYFLYAALAILICHIYDLVFYIKYKSSNKTALVLSPALGSLFLFGYFTKDFFKPLIKNNDFNSLKFIIFLVFLFLVIYYIIDAVEYLVSKYKNYRR